ncbi:hypothetical protein ACQJBY_002688 [Aegilops geniculata]
MQKRDSSKQRNRVVGFGGGIRARDLRGPALSILNWILNFKLLSKRNKYSKKSSMAWCKKFQKLSVLCLVARSLSDSSHESQHDQDRRSTVIYRSIRRHCKS